MSFFSLLSVTCAPKISTSSPASTRTKARPTLKPQVPTNAHNYVDLITKFRAESHSIVRPSRTKYPLLYHLISNIDG